MRISPVNPNMQFRGFILSKNGHDQIGVNTNYIVKFQKKNNDIQATLSDGSMVYYHNFTPEQFAEVLDTAEKQEPVIVNEDCCTRNI